MLYSINEIMSAVRQELAEANKELGIAEGFTDDDYKYLGVIAAAAKRLPKRTESLQLDEKELELDKIANEISEMSDEDFANRCSVLAKMFSRH